jgi:predicted dehydrogenase
MKKVRWGVLGAASIAVRKVIPGMQRGAYSEITAIASRDKKRAEEAAEQLGLAKAYGSYEELLRDGEIDAVYNPLPNHLHVPWSVKAAEAGKHVLCEKPISLTVAEAKSLLSVRDRTGVKIGEAFMVKTHPQWLRTQEIIRSGGIGDLRAIAGVFSYFNRNPANVRHKVEWGGGGLLDIGCYPITMSRFIFGEEPTRVAGALERDPDFGTDRLSSAILEFPSGQSTFACSTQTAYFQTMHFLGMSGRIEIEIPWNAPNDRPCRIFIGDLMAGAPKVEEFPIVDQYTIQGDEFSRAIRGERDVPVPLEDSVKNMAVIEAIFKAADSGRWERPEKT